MINEAKRKAASANRMASDTMDKVDAIKEEIKKIGVAPGDSNLNNVLTDVDQSSEIQELFLTSLLLINCFITRLFLPLLFAVKNLLKSIPTLNDKISEVENLTSQFPQINNITGNIKKIKELIEQARDAANRVSSWSQDTPIQLGMNLPVFISLFLSPDCYPDDVQRHGPRGAASAQRSGGPEGIHVHVAVAAEARRQGRQKTQAQTEPGECGHVCVVPRQQRCE